jgi:hypothetical protein
MADAPPILDLPSIDPAQLRPIEVEALAGPDVPRRALLQTLLSLA